MPLMPQMLAACPWPELRRANRRIARPLGGLPRPIHIVHRGNNHAQRADIGGVLDVPFLRVGQPDHRSGADVRARGDHLLDVRELQRAVLHFKPGEVVMLGRFAIAGDIHLRLREAEDLLAVEQLLLGRVVKLSFRCTGIRALRPRYQASPGPEMSRQVFALPTRSSSVLLRKQQPSFIALNSVLWRWDITITGLWYQEMQVIELMVELKAK